MNAILQKTLGGLSKPYYFRHFVFGFVFLALYITLFLTAETSNETAFSISTFAPMSILLVINTLLYPYSRFVYESIAGFIMGNNVFFGSAFVMMGVKFLTMLLCWIFAIFIAPVGLFYLYFHHTKQDKLRE